MSKKHTLILSSMVLAVAAIIAGFCFVFLGNKMIKVVPGTLSVEMIEDDFYLITEYNGEFGYQFKLEQLIDGNFVTVDLVGSKTNIVNLSQQKMNIIAGQSYRFSARYTTENGAGNGGFCQTLDWKPSWILNSVNYNKISYDSENEILSWDKIYLADNYVIRLVDAKGGVTQKTSVVNSLSVESLEVGKYKVFVFGVSQNSYLSQSLAGDGSDMEIVRKNLIVETERGGNNALTVKTSQKIQKFEVHVDGQLRAVLSVDAFVSEGSLFCYNFASAGVLFNQINFENSVVQIKSLAMDFVLESDFATIN